MGILDQISAGGQVVDVMGNLARGTQLGGQIADTYRDQSAKRQMIGAIGNPQAMQSAKAYQLAANPEAAAKAAQAQAIQQEAYKSQMANKLQSSFVIAKKMRGMTNPQEMLGLLQQEEPTLLNSGIEPTDIQQLRGMIEAGDGEGLARTLDSYIDLGTQMGIGQQSQVPADIQKYMFGEQLRTQDPEAYNRFQDVMRNQEEVVTINGVPTVVRKGVGGGTKQLSSLESEAEAKNVLKAAEMEGSELGQDRGKFISEAPTLISDYENFKGQTQDAMSVIDSARKGADIWTTGFVGTLASAVPGTPAHDFNTEIEILNANLALDSMQALKEASATGSTGLGATNAAEFNALKSEAAALQQSQSKEQFLKNLDRYEKRLKRYQTSRDKIYERTLNKYKKLTGEELVLQQQSAPVSKSMTMQQLEAAANAKFGGDIEKAKAEAAKYGYQVQ